MNLTSLQRVLAGLALVALVGATGATAQTTTLKVGDGFDDVGALVDGTPTNDEAYLGAGSFYALEAPADGTKFETILAPGQYTAPFTVSDIVSVEYRTKVDRGTYPQLDFYLTVYTAADGVDDDAWYGRRLTGEPIYAVGRDDTGDVNGWVEWTSADTNVNELRWYDSNNNGGEFGGNADPTLTDLQAGAFDWATVDGSGAVVDYTGEEIWLIYLSTGSGWSDFEGYVDALEVTIDRGGSTETLVLDLEGPVSDVYVDDDWSALVPGQETAPGSGRFIAYNAYATVQGGVDNVTGSTVNVAAGTYVEQVEIAQDLDLVGAGALSTTIQAFASMPLTFTTSASNSPIVYVHDAANVNISGLTVDGAGLGNSNTRFYGIAYRNAGGSVVDCDIVDVRNTPLDGSQHGNAFYLFNDDGVARSMTVQGCDVSGFQKNGITLNSISGTPLVVDVSGNAVTGAGVLTADNGDPAQNGFQLWGELITGSVANNTVDGIAYDNTNATTKWVATSMLDFYSGADFANNVITGAHVGIYKYDGYGQIVGNDISIEKIGVYAWGIIGTDPPRALPQPLDVSAQTKGAAPSKALLNVLIDGNVVSFSGPDNTATYGIEVDAGFGPNDLDATITNNTVNGFEAGVDVYQCQSSCDTGVFTSVVVNQNDLSNNTYGVRSNVGYLTVDASCNWYGDASGPASALENPAGTGSGVEGDVIFEPWLDGPGGACVLSTDYASVGPPPSELNDCSDCIDVPVSLTRLDANAARGVSVTFQLSSELELCGSPDVSIGAGTFYDGYVGDVQAFLVDNGGKSYTFDTAILGANCGPTVGGEVFTIPVQRAAGITADTQGTITVTGVTFRDCNNAPLPLFPGPGTIIDIDVTAPGAVTNLVASQVRTGNDADGTTKIDLTWDNPADPDVTAITIYRKGFGFYPEYDDAGGSVPTAPADPTAATGAGWALVTTLPAGTTSYSDEPNTRDFWYYVAFADDECYTSAVSNITDGELNYHLGDIAPPPNGNNQVFTGDISALGTAYGTSDGDVDYNAEADVGPTTDFSVTARPTTDNQIQFEDLIVFAINFNQVSRAPAVPVAALNALELQELVDVQAGQSVSVPVRMSGAGDLLGVSVKVAWNDDVLEYVGWSAGDLPQKQPRTAPVFSPEPGVVDFAVLGDQGQGLSGEGVLARLQFRVKKAGETGLRFEEIDARNPQNEKVNLDGTLVSGAPTTPVVVERSVLRSNVPNPFNPSTKVRFALAHNGPVTLKVYDVSGRLVRTLVNGVREAGAHEVVWDGTDDTGRTVSSGTYLLRMQAEDASQARRLLLLK